MLGHALHGALILRLVFPRAEPARRRQLVGWWSAKLVRIAGLELRIVGEPPAAAEIGAMIVANHVSWLDMFAISGARPTRFIAKSEIRDWPFAGWIAERAGTLFIRRERRRDTARIADLVHAALAEGDCVGLFPEGTTTEGDTLLRFHSSLFEPAVANAAHVHPCAVRYRHADGSLCRAVTYAGERTFMQAMGLTFRQEDVTVELAFAPVIETRGRNRREVAAASEDAVASLLGLAPDRRPKRAAGPRAATP